MKLTSDDLELCIILASSLVRSHLPIIILLLKWYCFLLQLCCSPHKLSCCLADRQTNTDTQTNLAPRALEPSCHNNSVQKKNVRLKNISAFVCACVRVCVLRKMQGFVSQADQTKNVGWLKTSSNSSPSLKFTHWLIQVKCPNLLWKPCNEFSSLRNQATYKGFLSLGGQVCKN